MLRVGTKVEVVARGELAEFLRAGRERLQPEQVGLARRERRRVPGLRRHEVADLAGVSVTWYTWLEQGRDVRPSAEVLDALARALQFDEETRRHLRRLGGTPVAEAANRSEKPDANLLSLIDDLLPSPAYLVTPAFDFVAWNRSYQRLFVDPAVLEPERKNALWMFFTCPEVRERVTDWKQERHRLVARFRAEAGRHQTDQRFRALTDDLSAVSADFRESWALHRVQRFAGRVEVVRHPEVGTLRTRLTQLRPVERPSLTLMIHRPVDDDCRERLRALAVG